MKKNMKIIINLLVLGTLFIPSAFSMAGINSNNVSFNSYSNNPLPPTIVSESATPSINSATLIGSVNPNGTNTQVWYETPTSGPFQTQNIGNGNSFILLMPYNLTGLNPDTFYKFRVVAINSGGTTYGSWITFKTLSNNIIKILPTPAVVLPSIVTAGATSNTTTAVLDGSVDPNGFNTQAWFETTSGVQLGLQNIGNGNSPVALSPYTLTGLTPNTNYTFRVGASNSNGNNYSPWKTFNTTNTIINNSLVFTSISPNSGTLGQTLNVDLFGSNFYSSGIYKPSADFGTDITVNSTRFVSSTQFTANITIPSNANLGAHNVTLLIGGTLISGTQTFTVNKASSGGSGGGGGGGGGYTVRAPSVVTNNATGILKNSSILNGSINPNRGTTTAWFEYGTSSILSNYSQTSHVSFGNGNSSSNLSQGISGLSPNTTYYFRAVGSNSLGTIRGSILSFTTTKNIVVISNNQKKEIVVNRQEIIDNNNTDLSDTQNEDFFNEENYQDNNLTANAFFGFTNIFPRTMIGWLIILILVLTIIIIIRKIYLDGNKRKLEKPIDANHIENLPM